MVVDAAAKAAMAVSMAVLMAVTMAAKTETMATVTMAFVAMEAVAMDAVAVVVAVSGAAAAMGTIVSMIPIVAYGSDGCGGNAS